MNKIIDECGAVWKVFVGEGGSELSAFNSEDGQFPPKPGSEGYIAIGWAAIGDMRVYKNRPEEFMKNFQMLYPHPTRVWANEVWNFAYEMQDGDLIMSTSEGCQYLLIGRVIGEYQSEYDNWERVSKTKTRADLMHLRRVQWLYIFSKDDEGFLSINKSTRMAVTRLSMTIPELLSLADSQC